MFLSKSISLSCVPGFCLACGPGNRAFGLGMVGDCATVLSGLCLSSSTGSTRRSTVRSRLCLCSSTQSARFCLSSSAHSSSLLYSRPDTASPPQPAACAVCRPPLPASASPPRPRPRAPDRSDTCSLGRILCSISCCSTQPCRIYCRPAPVSWVPRARCRSRRTCSPFHLPLPRRRCCRALCSVSETL